ncbi:hypothetical protein D3C76_1424990 [compost metagenome]
MRGGFQNAFCLFPVDVVLIRQALCGAAANILMTEATFHFVQHAFTQCTVGQTQLADRQRIKYPTQNCEARYKYGLTFVG